MNPTPPPEPGVYADVPAEDYHAWDCASNSRLSRLAISAKVLRHYLDHGDDDTPARLVGRAVHTYVLEPDRFESLYPRADQCFATKRDGDRCSNGGVWMHGDAWVCGVHARSIEDCELVAPANDLTDAQRREVEATGNALRADPVVGRLLESGRRELSIVWIDELTGVRCKGRLDYYDPDRAGGTISELKTSADPVDERSFLRTVKRRAYYRQAAMYVDAVRANDLPVSVFAWWAAEKKEPNDVAVWSADALIPYGRDQYQTLLALYAEHERLGWWPGHSDRVQPLGPTEFDERDMNDATDRFKARLWAIRDRNREDAA